MSKKKINSTPYPREVEREEFVNMCPFSLELVSAGAENIYFKDVDGNEFFIKESGMTTVIKALQGALK